MSERKQYTDYFGVDLGDGESAVAWMRAGKRTEPQMIELRGRKSVISAIGRHPQKGMMIGEEACQASGLDWLRVRFKSRYLTDPKGSGEMIEAFAHEILGILKADGRLDSAESAFFFIGCPSGWSKPVREAYREHFVRAGMVNCEVISESRAAFMFARESGELRVSDDLLTRPTLIIDAGSSTTDFTYVADLNEKSLRASDFGEVTLGGGLIDRLVLDKNILRCPQAGEIAEILDRYPAYAARCEFEARRVKEMYFTQQARGSIIPCESALKLYAGRTPLTLDISVSDEDMQEILNRPLNELKGMSFIGAYREALRRAQKELTGMLPETILLTGGASRMPLISEICREIFPEAQVLKGLEPEYAIARGLCHALRIDQRIQGFSEAVHRLIESDDMENLVTDHLSELYRAVSVPLTDQLIDGIAPDVFRLWRAGGLKSINDISDEIAARARELLGSDLMRELIRPAVGEWVSRLRPEIEKLTDPICDEFDLPRTSLRLPEYLTIQPGQLTIHPAQLVRMDELKAVIDVAAGAIAAGILGGSGMALLAAGLPGLIAGFIVGILAGAIGTEAAEKMLRKAELPSAVRRLFSERVFRKSLSGRREQLRSGVCAQLLKDLEPPTEQVQATVKTIAQSIEGQLEQMMERAALLIH